MTRTRRPATPPNQGPATMESPNQNEPAGFIRITRSDAMSGHVDDLLAGQMSLRGE